MCSCGCRLYVERRQGLVNAGKQEAGANTLVNQVRSLLQFWRNLIEDSSVVCRCQSRALR